MPRVSGGGFQWTQQAWAAPAASPIDVNYFLRSHAKLIQRLPRNTSGNRYAPSQTHSNGLCTAMEEWREWIWGSAARPKSETQKHAQSPSKISCARSHGRVIQISVIGRGPWLVGHRNYTGAEDAWMDAEAWMETWSAVRKGRDVIEKENHTVYVLTGWQDISNWPLS